MAETNLLGNLLVKVIADTQDAKISVEDFRKSLIEVDNITQKSSDNIKEAFRRINGEAAVWGNSTDLIAQKQRVLKDEISSLIAKGVDPTGKAVEKLVDKYYKLGDESEALAKSQAPVRTQFQKLGDQAKELDNAFGGVGQKALALAKNPLVVLATAAVAISKAFIQSTSDLVSYGDKMAELSDQTGLSTDSLQEYKFIAEQTGGSLESITNSVKLMTRGLDTNAETFKRLGVQLKDSRGNFRSQNEIFDDTIAALSKVTNETDRSKMALEIFGRDALSMVPLLKLGGAGLEELKGKAHDLGLVMAEESIRRSDEFKDSTEALKASWKAFSMNLVKDSLPALISLSNLMVSIMEGSRGLNKVLSGGTTGDLSKDLKIVNDQISSIKEKLMEGSGLQIGNEEELQAELKTLQAMSVAIGMKIQGQRTGRTIQISTAELEGKQRKDAEAKEAAEQKYLNNRKTILAILQNEKTEYEQISDQIKELENTKWSNGKLEQDRLAAIEALKKRQVEITEEEYKQRADKENEANKRLRNGEIENTQVISAEAGKRARALAEQEQSRLATQREFNDLSKSSTKLEIEGIEKKRDAFIAAGVDETKANKWAQKQILNAQLSTIKEGLAAAGSFFAQLASMYQQDAANRTDHVNAQLSRDLTALDEELQAKLRAAGLADETEIESLNKQLAAAIAAGDEETANELRKKIKKAEIEDEYQKKKDALEKKAAMDNYKIAVSAFKTNQEMSKYQAAISAAQGAIAAYQALAGIPFVGPVLGAAAAAAVLKYGQRQIQIIDDQEPPAPPALAKGGKVFSPTLAIIGDNPRYDEVVAPLSPEVFGGIADGIVNALASRARPLGVTPATAGVESLSASRASGGQTILQVGTLIADDAGKRWLSRTLRKYDVQESKRVG